MREEIDTNSNYSDSDIPDGTYGFEIVSCTRRYGGANKDKPFYSFKLTYEGLKGDQILMPFKMGDLLRVLKCTETSKGKFDWDPESVNGKKFTATVVHEADQKDPTKIRQNMVDFKETKEDLPF